MKYISIILLLLVSACRPQSAFDPSKLGIEWELVKNNYDNKGSFLAAVTFVNRSDAEMPASGWKIFFNLRYHRTELASTNAALAIKHANGELFTITPTASAAALAPGQSIRMEFTGQRRVANFQDVPSGFFWVNDDNEQVAIELQKPTMNSSNVDLPQAEQVQSVDVKEEDLVMVLPTPLKYKKVKGEFVINKETAIVGYESQYLVDEIEKITGFRLAPGTSSNNSIIFKKKPGAAESYSLSVNAAGITITSPDAAGAFYAIQSLKQLFPVNSWSSKQETIKVPAVEIEDKPRFPFRAFMLDVGRNFESKTNVLRLIEVMSLYKLNTFHFHLNDDEGWRLEIPDLPELTDVGAKRGYPYASNERLQPAYGSGPTESNHFGTGYYTREDFIEILKYATERHVTVIPEIESPGHARAAIKAMKSRHDRLMKEGKSDEATRYLLQDLNDQSKYLSAQYFTDNVMDASMPGTYAFVDKVIGEIKEMYTEANAPLTMIHMGGDEVPDGSWSGRNAAQLYADFFVKATDILAKHGLKMTGWQELVTEHIPHTDARKVIHNQKYKDDNLQFDAWWDVMNVDFKGYEIANAGYKTVMTCFDYYYFDLAQAPGFNEPGDAWIGYLGLQKSFSFNPYDVYTNYPLDFQLNPVDPNRFKGLQRLTPEGRKNIVGLQAALWAENMTYGGYMEYQILPRLLALAERAWGPEPGWAAESGAKRTTDFNKDWSVFANKLGKRELPRLDYYNGGYAYRLPTPYTRIEGDKLAAYTELPGVAIRYTTDGTEPTQSSPVYTSPVDFKNDIKLRAFSTYGRGGATAEATKN
ncbi:MAG TPA: family 20 glycosylhydrolase [Cyclobacteriaceae bacterium]|nr:family 20 glycosylhydrolase [Cyclobacteriaceae bacterium]